MLTFKDMINAGIAPAKYKQYGTEVPSTDNLVRYYNLYWGALSDTHMSEMNGCWIITGSRVTRKELFHTLLTADHWEDVIFPQAFSYIMMQRGLCGFYIPINGQIAFIIYKWNGDKPNPVFLDDIDSSNIPQVAQRFIDDSNDDLN